MSKATIGYYVHHHGTGHMQRALRIIPHIPSQVILFSSADEPKDLPANVRFVKLIDDAVESYNQPTGSAFMYTPHSPEISHRYQQILQSIIKYDITCMYVDVSMEVAIFCKTLGLTVGHNIMQGIRDDQPHTNLYRMCDFYLSDSTPELDSTSRRVGPDHIEYVGGISRYPVVPIRNVGKFKNIVVTVSPKSSKRNIEKIIRTAQAFPDSTWHVVGPAENKLPQQNIVWHGVVQDPYEIYRHADVVVGAGGHNTITEMASLGLPFVCIPEERPYDEQATAAQALANHTMAMYLKQWPEDDEWRHVFGELCQLDLHAFQTIVHDDAASRAAAIIVAHAQPLK